MAMGCLVSPRPVVWGDGVQHILKAGGAEGRSPTPCEPTMAMKSQSDVGLGAACQSHVRSAMDQVPWKKPSVLH